MLTGDYKKRAKKNHLPKEAAKFLKDVREGLRQLDLVMNQPSSPERGKQVAQCSNYIEMAADAFELWGVKVWNDAHPKRG